MSETRCKGFKESQKKGYVETVKSRVLVELHKRREALIAKLRNAELKATSDELSAAAVSEMINSIIKAEAELVPELTDKDIEELRLDFNRMVEESCPSEVEGLAYLSYSYENQPVCPYCSSILTYANGVLYCGENKCFQLALPVPVSNVADIAWQMKTVNEKHKY